MAPKKRRKRRQAATSRGTPSVAAARVRPARRRPSRRVLVGGAIALAVVAGGVAAGVALTGGSGKQAVPASALPGASEVHALLDGIPQQAGTLGKPSAPVEVIEYADVQCPYCRDAEAHTIPDVITRYVRTGKAVLELRLLAALGSDSSRGRSAALAAGRQDRMFDFVAVLYRNQGEENTGWLTDAKIRRAARSVPGLDVDRLVTDMSSGAVSGDARRLDAQMAADHVTQTPTFFVGKRGGRLRKILLSSSIDRSTLPAAIDAAARS